MKRIILLMTALLVLAAAPAAAQLGLPPVALPSDLPGIGDVTSTIDKTIDRVGNDVERVSKNLVRVRDKRLGKLLRRHADRIERDEKGDPARRGELLLMDIDPAALGLVREAGFRVIGKDEIEGLGVDVTRLAVPAGMSLPSAQQALRALMPETTVSADTLHFTAGGSAASATPLALASSTAELPAAVGIIDGAPGGHARPSAARGFAEGAPFPSNHGSAIVSLLASAGVRDIRVADVYGTDPAGGNALAIAKALGWLTANGARVVTISLVGPRNAVLQRAITAAQRRGVIIVAAVGNDGPAAPPAYPASYEGVLAVTGVDSRNRALIEAGKALHLDYAAPGAGLLARNAKGKSITVRGTSFAVPLVAARAAFASGSRREIVNRLDREAVDLGAKGHDGTYGRGLVCGQCRP